MDIQERRKQITDIINEQGAISFIQLKKKFSDISEMTLRNDLRILDEQRIIVRVHGGAKSIERIIGTDDFLNKRLTRNLDKKRIIAQKAAKLLLPGTSVFLDSGSSAIEFAKIFPDQQYLVMTSGLHCAIELAKLKQIQIIMPGGILNVPSMSISGSACCSKIREMNFDIAFLGTTGYMDESGFTCGAEEEKELKKTVIDHAAIKVILMDSTKVDITNTFSFASPKDINIVISDDELNESVINKFHDNGIKLL